jgi:hypothetical protein
MDSGEDIPIITEDSSERRLARLERRVELLRQSTVPIAQVVQQLRDMTVRREAGDDRF